MVEVVVRVCVSICFLAFGLLGYAPLDVAWKAAAALAGVSVFGWLLERRGLKNSGVAGFFAVAEAFILSVLLSSAGALHEFGFLTLIPCVFAAIRFSSPMISMSPLIASGLVASDCLFAKNGVPSPAVLAHAAGVLSVSLLLGQRRHSESPQPQRVKEEIEEVRQGQLIEDGILQLRESYRKLRDAYSDLERRSRKDKIAARVARVQGLEGEKFYTEMCVALRELTKAEELAIYTLAHFEQVMVVRSVSEDFPGDLKDRAIDVDVSRAPIVVREQAENALAALSTGAPVANVLLIHKGKMVGMICAIEPNPVKLEEIRKALTEAAPIAARAIDAEIEREGHLRRVKELELLYEVGSLSSGASTPTAIAGRITRELKQGLRFDSVTMAFIERGKELILAREGTKAKLLDCMSFLGGEGLQGWLSAGAPELVLFDVRRDSRCQPEEALKRRIGSFVLIPIWTGAEVVGYLSAASHVTGGIDVEQISTLRLVGAELSRALERLSGTRFGGMMTPKEFSSSTEGREGTLIYLEPLRREQMIATYGFAAFEESVRKLAHQVRAKLPTGSYLCRRDQGDFLVFFDTDEEFARNWANEIAASASFIAISTSDPTKRVPLALRAKVAQLTSQSHQLSAEFAA